jgi:hypothetical protein
MNGLKKKVANTCGGILLGLEKNEILLLATTWMKLENITLSEISWTQIDT